jgi:GH24 family phage-related lysozyme (muramidase)/uncharacterized Zn-binding protein involved in type VI secretion
MSKLAARKSDKHNCPKKEPKAHGEGSIIKGSPNVTIEGMPAARVGDKIECEDGSITSIADNESCLIINGKRAARLGDKSDHDGEISSSAGSVFIADGEPFIEFGDDIIIEIGENVFFGGSDEIELSSAAEELLKGIEKLRLKPYYDGTGKEITAWRQGATIGYGHLIRKDEWNQFQNGITKDEADALFKKDLVPYTNIVNKKLPATMTQQQFDASTILAFNIGESGFANSSVVKLINDPLAKTKYTSLEHAWKAWDKAEGVVNQGIINRRNAEWKIYTQGVYKQW